MELHLFNTANINTRDLPTLDKNKCGNCGSSEKHKLDFLFFDCNNEMSDEQKAKKTRTDTVYKTATPQCDTCSGLKLLRLTGKRQNVENADLNSKKDTMRQEKHKKKVSKAQQRVNRQAPVLGVAGAAAGPAGADDVNDQEERNEPRDHEEGEEAVMAEDFDNDQELTAVDTNADEEAAEGPAAEDGVELMGAREDLAEVFADAASNVVGLLTNSNGAEASVGRRGGRSNAGAMPSRFRQRA